MPTDPATSPEAEFARIWDAVTADLGLSAVIQMSARHFHRWILLRDAARLLPQTSSYYQEHPDQAHETVLEIYRAMATMTYAILEDTFRETLRIKLKQSPRTDFLKKIPLWDPGRTAVSPERFDLSDLAKHKRLAVKLVIERSIDSYLDQKSFSSTDVIATHLHFIQDNFDFAKPLFPLLQEMINRRHQIAHTVDRPAHDPFTPTLTEEDCNRWMSATLLFINELNHQLHPPSRPDHERQYQQFSADLQRVLEKSM